MQWEFAMGEGGRGFRDPRMSGWHAMTGRGGPRRGGRRWGGGGMPGPFEFHRGGRARRGDIRVAILELLAEEPRNGYQLMREIERRSQGAWRPSSGSVYPKLQQLEDEGLVRAEQGDGGRLFHITDAGRAEVEARGERDAAPWEAAAGSIDSEAWALMSLMRQIGVALWQIVNDGSQEQVAAARTALADARTKLHEILADDAPKQDED